MADVIDFQEWKDRRLGEVYMLKTTFENATVERGFIIRGQKFIILQGRNQGRKPLENVLDLNHYSYQVNNQLVIDGWDPIQSISFDENFFLERVRVLSKIKFPNIRMERSKHNNDMPCVVVYGKF